MTMSRRLSQLTDTTRDYIKFWAVIGGISLAMELFIIFGFMDEPWGAYFFPLLLPAMVAPMTLPTYLYGRDVEKGRA